MTICLKNNEIKRFLSDFRFQPFLKHAIWGCFALLTGCMPPPPPTHINHLCHVFQQYPEWYVAAREVEARWKVPVAVQMAIIHQESKFNATAQPPRQRLLGWVPWKRPTSAYGYSQALDGTWALYKQSYGGFFASRERFSDAVDFIGWYAQTAYSRAHIARSNPYALYLAYHEGVGGYLHRTYLRKPWLLRVAQKVKRRAALYQAQLKFCSR